MPALLSLRRPGSVRRQLPPELVRLWRAPATHHGLLGAVSAVSLAVLLVQLHVGQWQGWKLLAAWFAALVLGVAVVWLVAHHLQHFEAEVMTSLPRLYLLALVAIASGFSYLAADRLHAPRGFSLLPAGAMLLTIFINPRVALLTTILDGLWVVLSGAVPPDAMIAALGGSLIALFAVHRARQRFDIAKAGLVCGTLQGLLVVAIGVLHAQGGGAPIALFTAAGWGAISGVVSAVVAVGVLPYLEHLTGITTVFKLMELANPSQPLLRHLLLKAPGTYHHSILVGNLGESAAEAIGADPLLVRVGAYYHDIGKTRRPNFFIENQLGMENCHDRISPRLSTLVITSHVKEGLEMAREYKLPRAIADFIPMHHGTSLVAYFYHQAKQQEDPNHLHEGHFRYPGPRPNTKETAIVMLADAIEATVRTLKKPTPEQIDQTIRRTVNKRLQDGELSEAPLTLQDLERIIGAFNYVLQGMFHNRIEYPDQWAKDLRPGEARRQAGP